jgi:hypothetical protein
MGGKERRPPEATPQNHTSAIPSIGQSQQPEGIAQTLPTSSHPLTKNQEILEKMRGKKD